MKATLNVKKVLAVINATYAVAKRKPKKKPESLHSAVQIYEFHILMHNLKATFLYVKSI